MELAAALWTPRTGTSDTMHSGSYGYNYNGMDLSVSRSNSTGPLGRLGTTPGSSVSSPGDAIPAAVKLLARVSGAACLMFQTAKALDPKATSPPSDQINTTAGNNLTTTHISQKSRGQRFFWDRGGVAQSELCTTDTTEARDHGNLHYLGDVRWPSSPNIPLDEETTY